MGLFSSFTDSVTKVYQGAVDTVKDGAQIVIDTGHDLIHDSTEIAKDPTNLGNYVGLAKDMYFGSIQHGMQTDSFQKYLGQVENAFGIKTPQQKAAEKAQDDANAEATARTQDMAAATSDTSIDNISRQEIVQLYQQGASSAQLAGILRGAKDGSTGVYAVRKQIQNEDTLGAQKSGRAQTTTSLGYGGSLYSGGR